MGRGTSPFFILSIPELMNSEIPPHLLALIVRCAAEMGAKLALSKTGKIKPYLSKNEAFRLFGRKNVERWINDGLVTPRKDGGYSANWRIDRFELEAIAVSRDLFQQL